MMPSESLSSNERKLLTSFFFFVLAWPVFSTFTQTFLWRNSHDPLTLIAFNIGLYVSVPLGFLLNSALLHRYHHRQLFFIGCILQGVGPLLLTLANPSSLMLIMIFGACLGIPMGLYWGNRNLLTLRVTEGRHRMAFLSAESVQNMLAGIVVPVLIGTYLAKMAEHTVSAYVLITALAFGLLLVAGWLAVSTTIEVPHARVATAWITKASTAWNHLRAFEFLDGAITMTESILSLMMILTFLGMEDAVGSTKSSMAIVAAVVMYLFGKRVKSEQYRRVLLVSFLVIGSSAAAFAWKFDAQTAVLFFAGLGFVAAFRSTTMMSSMYRIVDEEVERTGMNRFAYLLDREAFLNLGRVSVLILITLSASFVPTATLRYGLLASSLLHIPLLFLLKQLQTRSKDIKNTASF